MATTEKDKDEVKLYQRGNEQVVLNDYISRLESGFNDWLDSKKLKDKQKAEVRAAYAEMINALNEDPTSFTAILGGGFSNTHNWTNAQKGFDKYGVAASYFGDTLRGMSAYKKPESKSTKIKYDRNSALITPEEQAAMFGTEYIPFINLDTYDEATQTRGITQRKTRTINGLEDILKNLNNTREFESDEDRLHAEQRIKDTISLLNDADANNDWFALSQLGITKPQEWFYTGSIEKPQEEGEKPTPRKGLQFEQFMQQYHPVYNGTFMQQLVLQPQTNIKYGQVQQLFDNLKREQLIPYLNDYITNRNYNFLASPRFTKDFPNVKTDPTSALRKLNSSDFAIMIINSLSTKGFLKQFNHNGQTYYDLGFGPNNTNTSYVYNPATRTISQMRQHEIPHWQQKFIDEYNTKSGIQQTDTEDSYLKQWFPAQYQKDGGVLKAKEGTSLNGAPSGGYNDIWQAVFYDDTSINDNNRYRWVNESNSWELRNDIFATDNSDPNDNKYTPEGKFDETNENYKRWLNLLKSDKKLAEAWARRYKTLNNNITSNVYTSWFDASDKFDFENFKKSTIFSDGENGIGHDIYRGKVYLIKGDNGSPMYYNVIPEGYQIKTGEPTLHESGLFNIYDLIKTSTEEQNKQPEGEEKPEETQLEGKPKSVIAEKPVPDMPEPSLISRGEKVLGTLGLHSLRALRLASSLQSNEKIANTLKSAMTPYSPQTFELQYRTTGDLPTRQFKASQAADTRRIAYLPFTSDASLMTDRMFEGNRQANMLETEGFLADNQEIKRTQAESLRRAEDNIARRSAIANENMKSILNTNLQRAQVDAGKLQKGYASQDAFKQQLESDLSTSITNKQRETEAFATQVGEYNALDRRQRRLDQVRNAYMEYKKTHPGATVEEFNTHTNGGYSKAMKDIDDMYKYDMLKYYRGIKGYNINLPQQKTWRLSKYISSKNGGRLNLSTDYLINKVINESNT